VALPAVVDVTEVLDRVVVGRGSVTSGSVVVFAPPEDSTEPTEVTDADSVDDPSSSVHDATQSESSATSPAVVRAITSSIMSGHAARRSAARITSLFSTSHERGIK
jgi:hypothetical protein